MAAAFSGKLSVRHRLAKYALNSLMEIFKKPTLATEVLLSTLDRLMLELLSRLVDPRLKRMDDGLSLIKALDVLMLKVLENADRTSSFIVLVNALREKLPVAVNAPSNPPVPATGPGCAGRTKPLVELVLKCTLKIVKAIPLTIDQLNLTLIINALNQFFTASAQFPPATLVDEAQKVVRTILSEFVRMKVCERLPSAHLFFPSFSLPSPLILCHNCLLTAVCCSVVCVCCAVLCLGFGSARIYG